MVPKKASFSVGEMSPQEVAVIIIQLLELVGIEVIPAIQLKVAQSSFYQGMCCECKFMLFESGNVNNDHIEKVTMWMDIIKDRAGYYDAVLMGSDALAALLTVSFMRSSSNIAPEQWIQRFRAGHNRRNSSAPPVAARNALSNINAEIEGRSHLVEAFRTTSSSFWKSRSKLTGNTMKYLSVFSRRFDRIKIGDSLCRLELSHHRAVLNLPNDYFHDSTEQGDALAPYLRKPGVSTTMVISVVPRYAFTNFVSDACIVNWGSGDYYVDVHKTSYIPLSDPIALSYKVELINNFYDRIIANNYLVNYSMLTNVVRRNFIRSVKPKQSDVLAENKEG